MDGQVHTAKGPCCSCSSDSSPYLPLTLQGRIFIDRSGALFDEVLSLLRDGPEWTPPEDRCVCRPGAGSMKGDEDWALQGERQGRGERGMKTGHCRGKGRDGRECQL